MTAIALPPVVVPRIPAMNARVCVAVPIRIVPESPAVPVLPTRMLLFSVVRLNPALAPTAVLLLLLVMLASAEEAVLSGARRDSRGRDR